MANIISGSNSSQINNGTNTADIIFGNGGDDQLFGLEGNDVLVGGSGNDILTGGADLDTFAFTERNFGSDTIVDFVIGEKIDLSALGIGDLATLVPFMFESGSNVVIETFYQGVIERITISGASLASLNASSFTFDTSKNPLFLGGSNLSDLLFGAQGNDQIRGGLGNDRLVAGAGNDILVGGSGNDVITGGVGSDIFKYDERRFGIDTISDFGTGDKIDLRGLGIGDITSLTPLMTQVGSDVVIETYFQGEIERIIVQNTTLATLTSARFVLDKTRDPLNVSGSNLQDTLFGATGSDLLWGGLGNDRLISGSGNDILIGGSGNDTLLGGTGADIFKYNERRFGIDTITDFSTGDKIDVRGLGVGDFATLSAYMVQAGTDVIIESYFQGDIEQIIVNNTTIATLTSARFTFDTTSDPLTVIGSNLQDLLFGAIGDDYLQGGSGNDQLVGGAGADILVGGTGADILKGGLGADKFRFLTSDSTNTARDRIVDFSAVQGDKIDLSLIDTNPTEFGDQALIFVTTNFIAPGQVQVVKTGVNYIVNVNLDGNINTSELVFQVDNVAILGQSDFIL